MIMKPNWLSLHIHYNSDPFWLLTETIDPLIAKLSEQRLLANYFFVRYWEQGPHIRLRLLPAQADAAPTLLQTVGTHVQQFLARRPSIFKFPSMYMSDNFKELFIEEYGEAALYKKYGPQGLIPFERNNSIREVAYEPEFERYGGTVGTAIAEQYFEASSAITLQVLGGQNGHDFRIVLGQAFRFFVYICLVFFEGADRATFAAAYQRQWAQFGGKKSPSTLSDFAYKYGRQRDFLDDALASCEDVLAGRVTPVPVEANWIAALQRLKASLAEAGANGDIVVPEERGGLAGYVRYLLPSYVHMHNNRLGLAISDEVYLAYLADQAFSHHV
jgi:thiopeptide-type bacteriocin biosynthesis protein